MPYKNPTPNHDNEFNVLSKRIYAFQNSLGDKTTENCKETCSKECIFRTVIGRSYYASFLHARVWLKQKGVRIKEKENEHAQVLAGLKREVSHAFSKNYYKRLLDLRILADYKDKETVKIKDAKDAITISDTIIKRLVLDD